MKPNSPLGSERFIQEQFGGCGPITTQAIKDVYRAFKNIATASGGWPEEKIMKSAVAVCASFQFTIDQSKKKSLPIIIPPRA